ncbi:MAG: dihydrofolate reductase [Lachnospiraceae bacterium]|nr:dihydrofolate reductase [Lachnospiraceae bacterium]
MQAIVAVDSNWGIGNKNELLVRIPNDQKMFRQETTGKVVVLGRKTIETFPGGKPLKNRTNIILTHNPSYTVEDAIVVHNEEELKEALKAFDTDTVYIIGGESIYKQFVPLCDTVHVTKIDHSYEADAFFPNLDENPDWVVAEESDEMTYFDITYTFVKYVRK